jgi:hypothetical protein
MHSLEKMLSRGRTIAEPQSLAECIDACLNCELSCVVCADACLGEREVEALRRCIRLNLDCADVCGVTARSLSRQLQADDMLRALVEACARACSRCEVECRRHASMHEHCRLCAATCRRCAECCREALERQQLSTRGDDAAAAVDV